MTTIKDDINNLCSDFITKTKIFNPECKYAVPSYQNSEILINICKSFEDQNIILQATFMNITIPIYNCNAVGIILEDIFYPIIKNKLIDRLDYMDQDEVEEYEEIFAEIKADDRTDVIDLVLT